MALQDADRGARHVRDLCGGRAGPRPRGRDGGHLGGVRRVRRLPGPLPDDDHSGQVVVITNQL